MIARTTVLLLLVVLIAVQGVLAGNRKNIPTTQYMQFLYAIYATSPVRAPRPTGPFPVPCLGFHRIACILGGACES